MISRAQQIDRFLATSEWASWDRQPIVGDASSRRYERLSKDDQQVILMDAPPEVGEDTRPFARVATLLKNHDLSPPDIWAHDPTLGIMVLSDLGPNDFAKWLAIHPSDATQLYRAAVDVLVHLDRKQADLHKMTPQVGGQMIGIAAASYANKPNDADVLSHQTERAMQALASQPDTIALRDYHAENLIWRPDLTRHECVGLLDFQDAFMAPRGYDLASLLRDARRDVDPALVDEMIAYFIAQTDANDEGFRAQLACLGAQRNMRILGVFARLAVEKGKHRYVDLIPRVWRDLMLDLRHPALQTLKAAVLDVLPPPDQTLLDRLRAP